MNMSGKILSIKGSLTDMSAFSFGLWTNKYIVMLSIPSYSISWLNPSDVGDKKC